ncbi:tRNA (pseudouridine(54)-N(1))-methyltransferase TrmY [Methanocorpusculum vombati]|uniref:tRNA (pseudouridine(54)-N(1))-methyltransferase n=1 Tax=Methanocorpusculum vombati TaxID=3002864 RepID=A0ABT4IND0_9EURY|nr:tRNA (pseudouridine(54)-N(1))-methyltransferase TrmY [Methanocorpusculum vombati]MCZ9318890.1 tRNA (pseudouridine(54)-N(1))-methyltransferase TrmY [Methanocorpusculum sp.]MCZ0863056.1 tRNA (pseudouridine(54)-N(1))-methyltransferase TrmY [Methanocorpusculum vombati]MDE2520279.1 tRNA (pseudouridine(54)-N(1))-methyltransferase TrmY [Methanocorpusculum sp.]MDE2534628.1 tRNA (pseudouridine(54)-N(1))-methyltransferase TrmY [Methanocorpusculum sp.]MDE2547036.1 tRNA (pseudouridine(54)-N(1))-methylt
MLRFAILGHKATTSPDFSLNDMPGGAGRMDVLCRCINSSFFLSHDLRRNTECYLILEGAEPHKTLRFSGETIRSLNPDERSAGALIKKGLSTPAEPEFRKAADGIAIRSGGLAELLQEFSFAVLDENGKDIRDAETLPENFILSDHMNFTEDEEALLKDLPRYSVGPRVLHADHTITVILNEFDRRERS